MSAVERIVLSPLVEALLSEMRLAPRQFVETFLDQEGLDGLPASYLNTLDEAELELFAMRWSTHGSATRYYNPVRHLPCRSMDAGADIPRPEYLDSDSVAEMMRGMYLE